MFGVVAVSLFGTTRYGARLGPTANFHSYSNAMSTIMQIVTGDDWDTMLADVSLQVCACMCVCVCVCIYI
jgi:hypothetical protein